MRRPLGIALSVFLAIVLVLLGWTMLRLREPAYQGKPLSVWLEQYGTNHWSGGHNGELDKQAEAAIRKFGTNAVPELLTMMSSHESPLKTNLLGRVPKSWLTRLHLPTANEYKQQLGKRRRRGAYGFIALGPDAKPFVPALVHLLSDTNYDVRYVSVFTLRCLGPVAKDALTPLIKCLDDPEFTVRDDAVMGLGTIHEEPERVIPILRNFIAKNRRNQILCQDAIQALGEFGTRAESAAEVVRPFLIGENSSIRSTATNTLLKIHPQSATEAGVK
jgi:hypothetical protein